MRILKLSENKGFIDIDEIKHMDYCKAGHSSDTYEWYLGASLGGQKITILTMYASKRNEQETKEFLSNKIDKILYYKMNPNKGKQILTWEEL